MSQQLVNTHHIYHGFWVFSIMGVFAALFPEPSAFWGWVLLGSLIVSGIWSGIGYYKRLDRRLKWRVIYGIVHFDLFSGYAAVIAWRGNGETFLGALLFFVPIILAGWIGHRYRQRILSEILEPRSW
ncbi:MAG: hypothetical protein M0Z65_04860, partial [Firmicutes bacterium]|nr:hypothetical protein [Bacillota bacterium]